MEIKYVIFEKSNVDQINFDKVFETSLETLRSSIDEQNVILKFIGETPSFLEGLTLYSKSEILQIINDPENGWITND
tara:strand:+ start:1217 stop:1447 length:231 start_codon:yes stop_codon:yes gene_type:complete